MLLGTISGASITFKVLDAVAGSTSVMTSGFFFKTFDGTYEVYYTGYADTI